MGSAFEKIEGSGHDLAEWFTGPGNCAVTFATAKGRGLLEDWQRYFDLAKAGQQTYRPDEVQVKALGLILLDRLPLRAANEAPGASSDAPEGQIKPDAPR